MFFNQDIVNCFDDRVGRTGISHTKYNELIDRSYSVLEKLKDSQEQNVIGMLNVPFETDDIEELLDLATKILNKYRYVVVLGTGGSTLNPQMFVALKGNAHPLSFLDHVDPVKTHQLLDQIDLTECLFIAISKSGNTIETIAQMLACLDALENKGIKHVGEHFLCISDPGKNPLRELSQNIGATVLDHNRQIGGRYASFTNVGLLPAAIAKLDIAAFREGASSILKQDLNPNTSESAKGAALCAAFAEHAISNNIMLPYSGRLVAFSSWYQQIWAESLGKNGKGTTPIRAIGTLDQHSQLQLYLDGPRDKFFSLISVTSKRDTRPFSCKAVSSDQFSYLKGRSLNDINIASCRATMKTLVNHGCPTRFFDIPDLDEKTLGALCMHFTLETIITAKLWNIDPFNQPAVEQGKVLTKSILKS